MKANLSKAIRNHAESLGIDDYLSILGLSYDKATEKVDLMSKKELGIYRTFLTEKIRYSDKEGENQERSLMEILTEKDEFAQFSQGNIMREISEYILEAYVSFIETLQKLEAKIKTMKTSDSSEKDRIFVKMENLNYMDLKEIFSSEENLTNFLRI